MVTQKNNDVTFTGTVTIDGNNVVANVTAGEQKAEVSILIR